MHKEDCFYLGKIVKKHSFKGEVVIKLDTDEPALYRDMESVFVDLGGNLVPFFIKKSSLSRSTMLRVHFEGVNNEEEADFIMKSGIYLPLNLLPKLKGNHFYFHEVIGFHVIDKIHGDVGIIVYINDKVALVAEPAVQKGMHHPRFQGRIAIITGKQGEAYKVTFIDGSLKKTQIVHPVHLRRQ